ncbi:MAG TPA: hypothetical protein DIU00_13675 [Phycisphaerales bacterium]|nr:hypothetical protein [Phycisphaerales bacterium]
MSDKLIYLLSFVLVLAMASAGSAGLEGYWPLNGDATDLSGNERHGTLFGDPNFEDGAVGMALACDGVDDYVNIDGYKGINAIDGVQQEFSVANWFKIAPGAADGNVEMVTWGASSGSATRLTWRVHQGRLRTEHNAGNLRGNTYVDDGEWHFGALVVTEGANLQVPATRFYVDGVEDTTFSGDNDTYKLTAEHDVRIGMSGPQNGRYWPGSIDEVFIFSRVLSAEQVQQVMNGIVPEWPKADKPSPADGDMLEDISVFLGWRSGTTAVSHDVYFDTTPDLGPDQLASQQAEAEYMAIGLEPGQTYYWRIDEVAADGTITTGDVWSFWTPPKRAYDPDPADGLINVVDLEADLNWTGGWGPVMHAVYFGIDADQVANAAGAAPQMDIGYDPGTLDNDTTYYWRVDEFYGDEWITGPVWNFSTVPVIPLADDPNLVAWYTLDEGAGKTAIDWSGHNGHGQLVGDVQWVDGINSSALEFDGSGGDYVEAPDAPNVTGTNSRTVTAWIKTADYGEIASWGQNVAGQKWIFRVQESNGTLGAIRVEVNGGYQVGSIDVRDDEWHHAAAVLVDDGSPDVVEIALYVDGFLESISAQLDEPIDTAAGAVRIGQSAWGSRPFNGRIDDVRIYDKAFTEDEIRQTFGNVLLAWQPQPVFGAVGDIWRMAELSWTPGDGAAEHDVYLGTDPNAVAAADASDTTGIYRGRQAETMYVPTEGLSWITTYYWRVDEVAADGTISTGRVWRFATTEEIVLYDEVTPFPYDNSADPFLSEVVLDLDPAQDWTGGSGGGIGAVAISYDGQAAPGSVAETDGNYTVVGRGADIWLASDQFQYAHTTLTGDGSMVVKVESLDATDNWTKAGIMIRESLDPGSAFAAVYATGVNGVRFQARTTTDQEATSDTSVATDEQKALVPPVWLKIERTFPMISAYYSTDGVEWTPMSWNPQVIPMTPTPIHIGLAVTSHSGDSTYAEAVFWGLSSTGGVAAGPLNSTEIGLESNSAEPMYLVLEDASGAIAAALNPDPAATQQAGTEWIIDLDEFGIDRTAVSSATLVIGNLDNPVPGGSGMLTINNVRLLPETYTFDGDIAVYGADGPGSLDGTWNHENGSDQWDGTGIGDPNGRPGGVSVLTEDNTTFLRLQDPGDPRDYDMGDPGSNRKIYFGHSITTDIGADADRILDGVTVMFRARVATTTPLDDSHPDGGGEITPWPAGGDGYVIHDGGKGNISIRQSDGDMVISFALALASDDEELPASGLVMNKLNGPVPGGDVDIQGDEPGTLNILELDPTQWHDYRIDISPDSTGTGTHLVQIYLDGSSASNDFIVTAGDGDDFDDSYIAIGVGATPQSGAIDIDYVSYLYR